jgi:heat shock protein HspQ
LLPNGRNWTTQLINQVGVYKGVVLDVEPQHEAHNSSYPHASEDTRIWANNINQYDGCV